jgi:pyruvate dehydrogenase E1 component alpha subunit
VTAIQLPEGEFIAPVQDPLRKGPITVDFECRHLAGVSYGDREWLHGRSSLPCRSRFHYYDRLTRRRRSDPGAPPNITYRNDFELMAKTRADAKQTADKANGKRGTLDGLDREQLHELLRVMLRGRRFEEKAAEAYAIGKIGGFCHLYIGQEAVAIGTMSVLRPDDYALAAYREHVQAIAKGMTPREVMAELYGKATGSSHGKGGSMHMFSAEKRFLGGWGIVGGQLPIATGVGWSIRYRGGDQVCVCFMGEAAVNQGAFHESLNMAALWKLPMIFIVENNWFGMGTAWDRAASRLEIAEKAHMYGMEGESVDGMDVMAMRESVGRAVDRAREDGSPTLIEAKCYRFMGHSMSDPVAGVYRTKEEVDENKSRDPIRGFIDRLRDAGLLSDDELHSIDDAVHAEADDAVAFAESSPEPDAETIWDHVYSSTDVSGRLFFGGQD